jgi:hypothetical protein
VFSSANSPIKLPSVKHIICVTSNPVKSGQSTPNSKSEPVLFCSVKIANTFFICAVRGNIHIKSSTEPTTKSTSHASGNIIPFKAPSSTSSHTKYAPPATKKKLVATIFAQSKVKKGVHDTGCSDNGLGKSISKNHSAAPSTHVVSVPPIKLANQQEYTFSPYCVVVSNKKGGIQESTLITLGVPQNNVGTQLSFF